MSGGCGPAAMWKMRAVGIFSRAAGYWQRLRGIKSVYLALGIGVFEVYSFSWRLYDGESPGFCLFYLRNRVALVGLLSRDFLFSGGKSGNDSFVIRRETSGNILSWMNVKSG